MGSRASRWLGIAVLAASFVLGGCAYLAWYAEEHGYDARGVRVRILGVRVVPAVARPGQRVNLQMRYRLTTRFAGQRVHVRERRQGYFRTRQVFSRETEALRGRGEHTTSIPWYLGSPIPIGTYRVRFSVSAGESSDSRTVHFRVR